MTEKDVYDFGIVDERGDAFEFAVNATADGLCRLIAVVETERGPRRTEVAVIPVASWERIAEPSARELIKEMNDDERQKRPPVLRQGINRLSPLLGRELGVLLIALMETGAAERIEAVLHSWRELAREERWWLYSKAAALGQQRGVGWRRALFHALSETSETRTAPADEAQKKSSGNTKKSRSRRQPPRTTAKAKTSPRRPAPNAPATVGKSRSEKAKQPNGKPRSQRKTTTK